ncbi:MAG: DEAD/DEAH box helicase, partial [Myxococcota bacterium]
MKPSTNPTPWTTTECFRRLHPGVQEWVHAQRWREIRPLQVAACQHILTSNDHLLLSAGVASGKTEAAFLPILSTLADSPVDGFEVLYIAPLVALINDQTARLERLAAAVGRDVTAWHGDIAQSVKQNARKRPRGVLLITPESLDSYLARHPTPARAAFGQVQYIVIDELHAFLNAERGKQLQSVLARLEAHAGCTPRRVGLSATLGDVAVAQAWLCPDDPGRVAHVSDLTPRQPPRIELIALQDATPSPPPQRRRRKSMVIVNVQGAVEAALAPRVLAGKHLVFANGRKRVEEATDGLRAALESHRSRAAVFAHHSNIAKAGKLVAEKALRDEHSPDVCLVCTSTLELGIDVPQVASVAQIGPPPAVSSLKQRAGRAGRGEVPGYLHVYCSEPTVDSRASVVQRLRPQLVQAIAMIELMQEGWMEAPSSDLPHLSTLVHQVLSLLHQTSGARPRELWTVLCEQGAFRAVDWPLFKKLLLQMKLKDLIRQDENQTLFLGIAGEKIATHYSFPVIFETPMEWLLTADGKKLGTLPRILPTLPR